MTRNFVTFFKDKTVTLLGLGLLGRGVGDAAFLARYCARVLVTDLKSAEELKPSLDRLRDYKNIEFFLGGHPDALFTGTDFVIKAAGVRLDNAHIALARKNNIPVYMSTALFAHLSGIKIIGITGTRGKTTVTRMIGEIMRHAGKKTLLGGNLRGVSTLAQLPEAQSYEYAVLELDSWQLQGFDDLHMSPQISVFSSFFPDHMNYYDGDTARYLRDKTAIFRHQKAGDILITMPEVADLIAADLATARTRCVIAPPLADRISLQIPGAHNRANAALAKQAAMLAGIDETTADAALQNFTAVEGRLQKVGSRQGRTFYNDSNSTTQEATLAALKSFPSEKIILIFGGNDKGLPIADMIDFIASHKIRSLLLKGSGSDRVLQFMPDMPVATTMQDAVDQAVSMSQSGDIILLSPGFTSFGLFKNEYDRSDQFVAHVSQIISESIPCPL